MSVVLTVVTFISAGIWLAILVWPVRPWDTRQSIASERLAADYEDLTVLIPARNEAQTIERCLQSVLMQGRSVRVVVVDDESTDDTADRVAAIGSARVTVLPGKPLPEGWTGKLWALQQGLAHVNSEYVLLIDADIVLAPGMLATLMRRSDQGGSGLVSILARLQTERFWERLLLPAYVYFFKLLYPFALVNSMRYSVAAAAGGCVLIRSAVLAGIGGFASIRDELIDDCALAAKVKNAGWPIHLALSRDVTSLRSTSLADIWRLVSRTAYTQLSYSPVYLVFCTLLMLALFVAQLFALFSTSHFAQWAGAAALFGMLLTQIPLLLFYDLQPLRSLALPFVACLFLLMTWNSAWRHWRGTGSNWKGRNYIESTGRLRAGHVP